jgi:hypothetical protein
MLDQVMSHLSLRDIGYDSSGEFRGARRTTKYFPADDRRCAGDRCCRKEVAELWRALEVENTQEALRLLREAAFPREVACRKSAEHAAYPIHYAVARQMIEVARELATPTRYAGVLQQRDGNG